MCAPIAHESLVSQYSSKSSGHNKARILHTLNLKMLETWEEDSMDAFDRINQVSTHIQYLQVWEANVLDFLQDVWL